ncbi:hypothetical protein V495_07783 [Pseudogymnoascus sp. VKM F-4514 (FW-929)]|nr:hypothetical protein V490_06172 [Pseudogymnoascus sp. VKM F-3557]KFY36566.1 hypothetical protein V495_07783 [Pseudogymnoascus sp. VKM F-4514 (FW-929)]KFY66608.1 hypothetical protein V497_00835 [Pseudogymnoascus sp. VKM F-4516 (FW-969)]
MSFVSISDIAKCANFTFKLYQYGFTGIYSANSQYTEFGQSVNALYQNLHQLEIIFEKVQSIPPCSIPGSSSFYDTRDLNAILDDPHSTIQECSRLLTRRDCFEEKGGFIRNIIWNAFVQDEVTLLHKKVIFHNIKILALLKPLELKLLLDIQSLVINYGEALLLVLGQIKELILGDARAIGAQEDVRCHQIVIPPYLVQKFEKLAIDAKPRSRSDDTFPMHDGINAFLQHYEEEAAIARLSRSRGVQPVSPTQWPRQYASMMRSIWVIQRIQRSAEYVDSCASGNQLLKYFVEDLAKKCLHLFNQHSDKPANPCKVKNEPDEMSLCLLGEEDFLIWPIPVASYDRPHLTEIDDMKTILKTPLVHLNPERQRSLVLLRQTETVLEMITKETSASERISESRSREFDLRIVTLSPIYADPQNQAFGFDIGLYTSGMPTHDNLLSFQTYETLYRFQEAITGYRVVDDYNDIDVIVMADKQTHYKARIQIWNFSPSVPAQNALPTIYSSSSSVTSASTIRPISNSNSSMETSHRKRYDSSARLSSPRKSTIFSRSSFSPSKATSLSVRSAATAVSDIQSLSDPRDSNTEAFIFQTPREPLLVMFLRPEKQPVSHKSRRDTGDSSDNGGGLTLLKIPIGAPKAVLEKNNCSCLRGNPPCTHSSITGPAKRFGTDPLWAEWWRGNMVNLAALGAHYNNEGRGGGEKQKLNHVKLTFVGEGGREKKKRFEKMVANVQEVDRIKKYGLEEEKVELRLRNRR